MFEGEFAVSGFDELPGVSLTRQYSRTDYWYVMNAVECCGSGVSNTFSEVLDQRETYCCSTTILCFHFSARTHIYIYIYILLPFSPSDIHTI